ncbi:MAG: C25 family cysteine peptidase, partial [Acidobacteriota bacterium]
AGAVVGEATVSGRTAADITLPIDPALLSDGVNTVELLGLAGDLVAVDAFTVRYERVTKAVDDRLRMPALAGQLATASGFRRGDIRLLDLSDPLRPRAPAIRILQDGATYRAVWRQSARSGLYYLATGAGVRSPELVTDVFSELLSTANAADYLMIVEPEWISTAETLAFYRQAQGLSVMLVSIEDVYDEFAAGIEDPRAIRDFLSYAAASWATPPRYAVLVGHGTYDFRDWYGLGGNVIPPLLWSRGDNSSASLFATDAPFADGDGDGVPSVALGRLPVLSEAELQAHIDKIIAYESLGDVDWDHRIGLVADDVDGAGDFPGDLRRLANLLPSGFDDLEVFLDDEPSAASARQRLLDEIAAGLAQLHYVGHGGLDRLSQEGLLTVADVDGLGNDGRPGLLSAASCTIGLHSLPGIDSLAEHMLLRPTGGSIAAYAPAWLSENDRASLLLDRFFRQLYIAGDRLGDAARRAQESAAAIGTPLELLYTYQLLGDPALVLQLRPEPSTPSCTEDCGAG